MYTMSESEECSVGYLWTERNVKELQMRQVRDPRVSDCLGAAHLELSQKSELSEFAQTFVVQTSILQLQMLQKRATTCNLGCRAARELLGEERQRVNPGLFPNLVRRYALQHETNAYVRE
jgi:hypothetical protein